MERLMDLVNAHKRTGINILGFGKWDSGTASALINGLMEADTKDFSKMVSLTLLACTRGQMVITILARLKMIRRVDKAYTCHMREQFFLDIIKMT